MIKIMIKTLLLILLIPFASFGEEKLNISLDEAINLALKQNLSIQKAEQELATSEINYKNTKTAFMPTIGFSSGYSWSPEKTDASGRTTGGDSESMGLSAGWSIWQGGKRFSNLKLQSISKNTTEIQNWSTQQQILYSVFTSYLGLIQAQKSLEVSQEALELAQDNKDQTQALLDVGSATRSDLLKSEVEVSQKQSDVITAQNSLEDAQIVLCNVLNVAKIKIIPTEPDFKELTLHQLENYQKLVSGNPSVKISEASVEMKKINTSIAKSSFQPTLSASYGYNWSGEDFDFGEPSHSGSVRLSWSIFEGGSRVYQVQEAKSNEKAAMYDLEGSIQDVNSTVESDYRKVKTNMAQWESAKKTLELAQQSYDEIAEMYKLGLATSLDLFSSQDSLNEVKLKEINTFYAIYTSYAKLLVDIGQLENEITEGNLF